jgi:hypothetical protein
MGQGKTKLHGLRQNSSALEASPVKYSRQWLFCWMKLPNRRFWILWVLLLGCLPAVAQNEPESPLHLLLPRVQAWNAALNKADIAALAPLYAARVTAYGKSMDKQACLDGKQAWLAKNAGYKQTLGEDFGVRTTAEGIELSFQKTTVQAGKSKTFDAYLVFDSESHEIVRESDLTTDATLAKNLKAKPLPQGKNCFMATGDIYPEIAVPTYYQLAYTLTIAGTKVTGEGSYYSWAMRTMYTLEISGTVLADNSLDLQIKSFGPMYPDDENDVRVYKEVRKFDGNQLIWAGGEASECREMEGPDCE